MADKWKETALCVIDMQNDFILEDGLMRVDGGKAIVPNVIKAVEIARQRGVLVVWGIKSLVIVGKCNFRTHDPSKLNDLKRQTVLDAVALNYQNVSVVVDATAAATPDIHVANIYDMKNIGVEIPTLQEWWESGA